MTDGARIAEGLEALGHALVLTQGALQEMEPIVMAMRRTLRSGATLYFAGNGGSAADAQHIAAEYVVRIGPEQARALRAVALTTDSSILTAAANDFGFERVFARQLEALGRSGDLLVVHSTSGMSANLVEAVRTARKLGMGTVALLGRDGGAVRRLVDHAFVVPSDQVAIIQEIHLALQHRIAGILTAELAG